LIKFVVFDTSSLLLLVKARRWILDELSDLIGPYVAVVPWPVLRELALLRREGVRAAVELVMEHMSIADSPPMRADDAVIWVAERLRGHVASGDRDIRRRARRAGLPIVSISKDGRVCVS